MPNSKTFQLTRRHALRGAGATMALPILEAMTPLSASAAAGALGKEGQPVRFAGFFMPNGVDHSRYTPKARSLSSLPPILQPLEGLQEFVNVFSGLNNPDGGHAAGTSAFLTGMSPKKTGKANEVSVKNPSIDQLIARAVKETTVLPSLELGTHTPRSGVAMSGHSHIYTSFVSWKTPTTPVPPEIDPQRAFDRLFKGARVTAAGGSRVQTPDKSVLDLVLEDAKDLQKRLGKADQQKLDEYLTAVRDVEERIGNQATASKQLRITPAIMEKIRETGGKIDEAMSGRKGGGNYRAAPNIPYDSHIKLHLDVLALAFWSNTTRSASFMFGDGLHGRNMSFLDGVDGNHHSISHHGNKAEALKTFSIINRYFIGQYAYFLRKLKSMSEGSSNVLENSLVLFGTNLSSGQSHSGRNVPAVLAGAAGGRLRGNRHIEAKGQPIANLHRTILDKMDVDASIPGSRDTLKGFS